MTDSWRELFDRADDHDVAIDALQDALAERRDG
jgi:hypothetical protein